MSEEALVWHFSGYGHAGPGDRLLVMSAAVAEAERRRAAREALAEDAGEERE